MSMQSYVFNKLSSISKSIKLDSNPKTGRIKKKKSPQQNLEKRLHGKVRKVMNAEGGCPGRRELLAWRR